MSGIWFPLAATAAAGAVTYYTCARGHCATQPGTVNQGAGEPRTNRAALPALHSAAHTEEIRQLRAQVRTLSRELDQCLSADPVLAGPRHAPPPSKGDEDA